MKLQIGILQIFFMSVYIIISSAYNHVQHKYLTYKNWEQINSLIKNPTLTNEMRVKINRYIYIYYDHWSYMKAYKFKKFHKYKCRHISVNELYTYASIGLIQCIKKYNGNNNFAKYADIYIQGKLYNAITELHPITNIPKKERIRKNINRRIIYNNLNKEWQLDKIESQENILYAILQKNNNKIMWDKIYKLSPLKKRVISYKFNDSFDIIRTNQEISTLMMCSEEHVRKNLKRSINELVLVNNNNNLDYNLISL